MTWRDVTLANNSAAFSVFDLWFGDAWIDGAQVVGNQVQSGSILNFESFRGSFQQVRVQTLGCCHRGLFFPLPLCLLLLLLPAVALKLPSAGAFNGCTHVCWRDGCVSGVSCAMSPLPACVSSPRVCVPCADPVGSQQGRHSTPQRLCRHPVKQHRLPARAAAAEAQAPAPAWCAGRSRRSQQPRQREPGQQH